MGGEVAQVAGEGGGVAGDVDDARGAKGTDGTEEVLVAAGAGRIHDHYVRHAALPGHLHHEASRVLAEKLRVFRSVEAGVHLRVPHGISVQLHADEPLHPICRT